MAAAATIMGAAPVAAQGSQMTLDFSSRSPATATGMTLDIIYRNPAHPDAKPPPVRGIVIQAPQGTGLNDKAVASCNASDTEVMVLGPKACPATSQVGAGTLVFVTGFGQPLDPYATDVTVFNDGQGLLEVVTQKGTGIPLGDDRVEVKGNTLTATAPGLPGGPPDFQTALREIDLAFSASTSYISTPLTCPRSHVWTSQAAFTFADGSVQQATSTTPCREGKHRGY